MIYHRGDEVNVDIGTWGAERIRLTVPCCNREAHPWREIYDRQPFMDGVPVECPGCKWIWKLRKVSDTKGVLKA